ncbi:MAG: alpha/beta fold hydrolase [Calditrichaeota bacterium]|nr:alpha/beta fold hydrolase [Candidatus Cloacimonadota bacterium]MCB1045670.1 alpha/beta fold hydrolase [Calditrichota bacterium]MCB9472537.1 alpha/beta fold hydrolase [Candidatus Delongbacteria bacterium]
MPERSGTRLSVFLEVQGWRLHVEALGSGPPLLLLHSGGGGWNAGEWDEGCRQLARSHRLWRYERPGYGLSQPRDHFPRDFFDQEERLLQALRERLGLQAALPIVGTSDGGTIALLHTARRPQSVLGLVVEGAHGFFQSSMEEELERRARKLLVKYPPGAARPVFAESMEKWFEGFRDPVWRDWSILKELGAITCPSLVVQGDQDAFVDQAHAHRLAAAIPGASCRILPDCRHLCHRSQPLAYYSLLAQFLSQLPPRPA